MNDRGWAVIAVQAAVSILLVLSAVYLLATGAEVPDWLTSLILLAVGSWFASGSAIRVVKYRTGKLNNAMRIRQRADGTWEQVDGG